MDDLGRVEVLDAAQKLVKEDLDVVGRQVLRRHDDLVQVGLHQFSNQVDFLEEVYVWRLKSK